MAKHHRKTINARKQFTVLCNCKCPFFGKRHENIWNVQCECGTTSIACGYCLTAGRLTCCPKCAAEKN